MVQRRLSLSRLPRSYELSLVWEGIRVSVAFLQGVAGGFLVVLLLILVVGGLLVAAVFGRAAGKSPDDRPDVGARSGLIPGRILCVIGLGFAVIGAFFVSIGTDILGMILGMAGYYLGARVFGVVIIVLSTITLFIGLLIGQGAIPGSYDEIMNGYFPRH